MLLKAITLLIQKKSLEAYRRYLQVLAVAFLVLGLFCLLLSFAMTGNDFTTGLLAGGGVGSLAAGIYYLMVCHQPKRLKRAYIAAYDERNKVIIQVASLATFVFLFLENFILIILYAFLGITLAYVTVLVVFLYSLLLGFMLFRMIFTRTL